MCVEVLIWKSEDSYGYKIISDLNDVIVMSESTLYPVLKRLETQGLLNTYSKDYNGRLRKYYGITSLGVERIESFLEEWKEIEKVGRFISGKVGA